MFALGPKLLLNIDDVAATKLLQPGNRATWRLLVAERRRRALERYRDAGWLPQLKAGQRMESVRDLRPEVRQTLDRAEKFLGLAALVAVLLAAVAVALAASRYLRRHLDAAAMFRCFGAKVAANAGALRRAVRRARRASQAPSAWCSRSPASRCWSMLAARGRDDLPPPTWMPGVAAFATGLLLLFGFALPPLVALARVPPLRVLRRDLPRPRAGGVLAYVLGRATIALLIAWQAREAQAGLIMVGGVARPARRGRRWPRGCCSRC